MPFPLFCHRCGAEHTIRLDEQFLADLTRRIKEMLMTTVDEALATVANRLDALRTDVTQALGDLSAALTAAQQGNLTPNQEQALAQIQAAADAIDDAVKAADPGTPAAAGDGTDQPAPTTPDQSADGTTDPAAPAADAVPAQ